VDVDGDDCIPEGFGQLRTKRTKMFPETTTAKALLSVLWNVLCCCFLLLHDTTLFKTTLLHLAVGGVGRRNVATVEFVSDAQH